MSKKREKAVYSEGNTSAKKILKNKSQNIPESASLPQLKDEPNEELADQKSDIDKAALHPASNTAPKITSSFISDTKPINTSENTMRGTLQNRQDYKRDNSLTNALTDKEDYTENSQNTQHKKLLDAILAIEKLPLDDSVKAIMITKLSGGL